MKEYIDKLKAIKKDELDERSFYEQVLTVIKDMEDVRLTPETAEQLKLALQEIGCMKYDEWKAEKDRNGEEIEENNIGKGIGQADISTAVNFVHQLLGDYENASFSLPYMLDGGEKHGWVQQWIKNSQELYSEKKQVSNDGIDSFITSLKSIKKDELDERSFYEQVLTVIKDMEDVRLTPETAEQLKLALQEIGCVKYSVWKEEKEKNEKDFKEEAVTIGEGIEVADIGTAVSFVSQLLGDYDNATYAKSKMLDGGEKYGWVQQWLKNSSDKKMEKLNIPYYQVAKEALMNWNGLSEEEAIKVITSSSFEQIEGQVWAKGSMDYAIEGLVESLSLTESDKEDLKKAVYQGNGKVSNYILEYIKPEIERIEADPNAIIMDTLFKVHDGWVKDNQKKFMARDKKHQHMPSELIGWKEAKADLLFIKSIFEAAGIEVDEQALEAEYNNRVKEFFLNRGIKNATNLADSISQGEEFYPALQGYGDVLVTINDPEYVMENVIPAIETKGIGKIEEVREGIVHQIADDPREEDIARLSQEETEQVEQHLDGEIKTLTEQRNALQQKNSIIDRIQQKAKERRALEKAIALEEAKKQKTIRDFND